MVDHVKVLVCGGRDYEDGAFVYRCLDALEAHLGNDIYVIEGGAYGADKMAWMWRMARGRDGAQVKAEWRKYGRKAGPIRNKEMLENHKPRFVVAFPGGKGTANMMALARAAGVPIWEPAKESITHFFKRAKQEEADAKAT